MRKKIVAGNWKMNGSLQEARKLASETLHMIQDQINTSAEVVLCPPFVFLTEVQHLIKSSNLLLGAQNCNDKASGAFTGEVSAPMLASIGTKYVILGHSERREYFEESDELLQKKVRIALSHDLTPIFCCGEKIEMREEGKQEEIVLAQLKKALFDLSEEEIKNITIAYEPVWAIGTGKTATSSQAQQMHAFIRHRIAEKYGDAIAQTLPILYGGSVKPENAKEIFAQPDVDGGLIGGASLNSRDFTDIVGAA